ncbi:CHAT domain-containing protein [Lasiosphaeris hirsuta]|uniref:CHAT domain-containing protein n=1 Tax=Lasiosphaeris hirsuta TaxID=260670 RepID=A0AA40BD09_9PEZI|nr:CHAT domain-containing protein [Lasiosphaeris hirsuta]
MRPKPSDPLTRHVSRKASRLSSSAEMLGKRFEKFGAFADLEKAISLSREAVQAITQFDRPGRPGRLSSLGNLLGKRFERTGNPEDLEEAIRCMQKAEAAATALSPQSASSCAAYRNSLGNLWAWKFRLTGDPKHIWLAISSLEKAVACPEASPQDRMNWRSNLATVGSWKYEQTQTLEDLQYAIHQAREALKERSVEFSSRAIPLSCLADLLRCRYHQTHELIDMEECLGLYMESWNYREAVPAVRISAAQKVANILAAFQRGAEASDLLDQAVYLLPGISSYGLGQQDQQYMLSEFSGLATHAASAALEAGKGPVHAIQLLELGRGVISSLKSGGGADIAGHQITDCTNTCPITKDEIRQAASRGPIVIINTSPLRCDAILIEYEGIRSVPLPNLRLDVIEARVGQFRSLQSSRASAEASSRVAQEMFQILEWLWVTTAGPVLDHLGFRQEIRNTAWPRLWWMPTGALSQLPLHAAGLHRTRPSDSVIDRAISSYTPSIKALLHTQSLPANPDPTGGRALLVSMPKTPGCTPLPKASEELTKVAKLLKPLTSRAPAKLKHPSKPTVLTHLQSCTIFHFTGHSVSDATDPSSSRLLLTDWQTSPLTVRDLAALDRRASPPHLAYLSACSTGANAAPRLQDEAITLMTACQAAGFRHAVGSLWDVLDGHSVAAARRFYAELRVAGVASVAWAVHVAARGLRGATGDPWAWAAFIHMGV